MRMRHWLIRDDPTGGVFPLADVCDCRIGADHSGWRAPGTRAADSPQTLYRQRRAARAAARALQLWPGAHGQVLRDEIAYGFTVLPWLGSSSRVLELINQILDGPPHTSRSPQ